MLIEAIVDRLGVKQGLTIKNKEIIAWPYDVEVPDQETLDQWLSEYASKKDYAFKRQAEYLKEGITSEALIVALWEQIVENRPEAAQTLQAKRTAVKAKHPKPA